MADAAILLFRNHLNFDAALTAAKTKGALFAEPKNVTTRKAGQMSLEALAPAVPELTGGSADLAGPNLTRVPSVDDRFTRQHAGNCIGCGMRGFGSSGPAEQLYAHFGTTRDAIVACARDLTHN